MKQAVFLTLICLAIFMCATGCSKSENVITRLDDAKNAKIGVMTGSVGEAIAASRFPNATVKSFDDNMDAFAAMKSGQLDATIASYPAALLISKKNPEFWYLPEPLQNEDTVIALKKGDDELLAQVDKIISMLKSDGTLESMKKRWFKADSSPYEEINITLPKEGQTLKIGVSGTREPFTFIDKNNKMTGHDAELARIIGSKLKRPVEFEDMKFMSLIPALQSGKIDLIVTGMVATQERRKMVNFTQPYFANAQVMLVKRPAATQAPTATSASGADTNGQISKLQDAAGKRICVLSGSAGDMAARKHFPTSKFQVMTAAADAALAIKSNKADAFIYDKSVLLNLVEKNPELVILDQPVDKLEVAAAIKKENGKLLTEMNTILTELKNEGVLQRLKTKWVDSKYAVTPQLSPIKADGNKGTLKMGTCANLEPFTFQSNGIYTGLDIDLSRLIGERLGKKVEIIDMSFEALIPALQSGKIDFALSNFNVTEERKKQISFSVPYVENDISALVRRAGQPDSTGQKNQGAKLASIADLKDKRIGVLLGSVHDTYATAQFPNAAVLQYKSPSDLILAVKSGKIDAGIYTRETLIEILRNDNELGLLGNSLFPVSIGIGFKKDTTALRDKFNEFLQHIRKNGVYGDMVERWMQKGDTRMPEIPNPKSNGVLVVGNVSDKGMPFTVVKDNKLIGFDIELSERFGAYLGKDVTFADMDFGSLIAAVSTGKIDMIASTLMLTEERKKQISFSDIYYELGTNAFALKKNIASTEPTADAATSSSSFLKTIATSFQSNIIQEKRYLLLWDGLKTTVIISVLATIFGTLLGALICFMRMSKKVLLNLPAKIYISILRGTPLLVLLMLIFYVVFASINISAVLVAVIAFGMNFAAYSAEIFRTGIEGVDKGQTEAGISLGFTKVTTFLNIILPQTVRRILPVYKGEFISLVKMTSIVGYIAVQDLTKASDIIRSRTFDAFFPLVMVAILYFLISWILMQALEYLERKTDPKLKQRKAAKA
ncbi:MAG: ABC transporter substrate-binding protein/permease [Desulfuromonadaceae bacterium]|nr:ABC transporter substrate-binding protein/permease [Desulfuromonadaceae bacterium]